MLKKTPLHARHIAAGAKMTDFAGWDMPLHYGSQLDEHNAVRKHAGMFDVSHMASVLIEGKDATDFLRQLLSGDVKRLDERCGLYTCMLNEQGGVIDDLIVYKKEATIYQMIVNAATTGKDLDWMSDLAKKYAVTVTHRAGSVILAVQGPAAAKILSGSLPQYAPAEKLQRFAFAEIDDTFIARTGYTGEDGYELIAEADKGLQVWDALLAAGVRPCGLGARDILRMEYGLALYGQDLDERHTPFESSHGWTVHTEDEARDFIGRDALQLKSPSTLKLAGLTLDGPIMRAGMRVVSDAGEGIVTSGGFSPVLGYSIALARVPKKSTACQVEIRGQLCEVNMRRPPFIQKIQK